MTRQALKEHLVHRERFPESRQVFRFEFRLHFGELGLQNDEKLLKFSLQIILVLGLSVLEIRMPAKDSPGYVKPRMTRSFDLSLAHGEILFRFGSLSRSERGMDAEKLHGVVSELSELHDPVRAYRVGLHPCIPSEVLYGQSDVDFRFGIDIRWNLTDPGRVAPTDDSALLAAELQFDRLRISEIEALDLETSFFPLWSAERRFLDDGGLAQGVLHIGRGNAFCQAQETAERVIKLGLRQSPQFK